MIATLSFMGFLGVLVAAAVVDVKEHRLPHKFAWALFILAILYVFAAHGFLRLVAHVLCALAVMALLVAIELWWRRRHNSFGQGMGDIKALGALMIINPLKGLFAYIIACLLLALIGIIWHKRAQPMLPYLAFSSIVLLLL